MTITSALLAFSAAAALLTVTPGLDTALVLRTALVEGTRKAFAAGLGVSMGVLAWGLIASLGTGAVSAISPALYGYIQLAGAAYLIWLGGGMLRNALRAGAGLDVTTGAPAQGRNWFARGLLTNLLNPKVGLFYVSFLPQFTPDTVNATSFGMLLASIHVAMGMTWFTALILGTRTLAPKLTGPMVKRIMDGLTGSVLLAVGVRLIWRG